MPRRQRLALTLYATLALGTTGLVLVLWACHVFRGSDLATVDARFAVRGDRAAPDVVVVAIDPRTLTQIGQFPFSRVHHARVIRRLVADGARVVAYDVQFTERGPSVAADNALVRAVAAAPRIVLGTSEVGRDGSTDVLGGDASLRAIGAHAGSVNVPNDPGEIVRRVAYGESGLASLPVVAARLARGAGAAPRADFQSDASAWIDFPGPPGTVRTVSFVDVERGRVDPRIFRGKVVVVGATAQSLKDVFPVATSSEQGMSGPEIQAAAIQTLLDGVPLRAAGGWLDGTLIVVLGLLGGAVAVRRGPRVAALAGLAAAAAFVVAAQVAFDAGLIVSMLYPLTALGLGFVGALGVAATVGAFERERVRDLFARFVPEAVVDDVLARADGGLRLGGERKIVTVMFSDVRGFTTYADRHTPEQVIDVLNSYLAVMSDVIHDHGGTLVAYMGDGIMAVFGAPTEQVDHADRAVAAAREMAGPALDRVNALLRERGDEPFAIGIGMHAGPVMAGNVGSVRRMEYTTIGDTTNTASRLEGMTKGTPHAIFLSDAVRGMLTRARDDLVHVDELAVRGKDEPVSVWSLT
ncbi:MAG TPA: adenylate/guanylate cyclase domain-containing protein [Solirubrobacteraceae bacterium]|jgi:adenylate cyclase|nr:adenylate/guanylate cyclase domain-containing protein [Solirubrobacteraceae bacterium]